MENLIDNAINNHFDQQSNEVEDLNLNFKFELAKLERQSDKIESMIDCLESHDQERSFVQKERRKNADNFSFIIRG